MTVSHGRAGGPRRRPPTGPAGCDRPARSRWAGSPAAVHQLEHLLVPLVPSWASAASPGSMPQTIACTVARRDRPASARRPRRPGGECWQRRRRAPRQPSISSRNGGNPPVPGRPARLGQPASPADRYRAAQRCSVRCGIPHCAADPGQPDAVLEVCPQTSQRRCASARPAPPSAASAVWSGVPGMRSASFTGPGARRRLHDPFSAGCRPVQRGPAVRRRPAMAVTDPPRDGRGGVARTRH